MEVDAQLSGAAAEAVAAGALRARPGSLRVMDRLAGQLIDSSRIPEAQAVLVEMERINPGSASVPYWRAYVAWRETEDERFKEMVGMARANLNRDFRAEVAADLGWLLLRVPAMSGEGLDLLRESVARRPDHILNRMIIFAACSALGLKEEAGLHARLAAERWGDEGSFEELGIRLLSRYMGLPLINEPIDVLFVRALNQFDDNPRPGERPDEALSALGLLGNRRVLEHAQHWSRAEDDGRRAAAAAVLGRLGGPPNSFGVEAGTTLLRMLDRENEFDVAFEIAEALADLSAPAITERLPDLAASPDPESRVLAARATSRRPEHAKVFTSLAGDTDERVRHEVIRAASNSLGVEPEIRRLQLAALDDPDIEVWAPALVGLAHQRHPAAFDHVLRGLRSGKPTHWHVSAAWALRDPRLCKALFSLKNRWEGDPETLSSAFVSCREGKPIRRWRR